MSVFGWTKKLTPYAAAVGLCAVALCLVLELWRADLNIPFQSAGDALVNQAFVKTLLVKGAYYRTDRIGAPFASELRDFPEPESLSFTEMRLLSWLLRTKNPERVVNLFFLLTFFLTTLSALFVFRYFKVAVGPALAVSVLYAFLPYHFYRYISHLFLTAYYLVPLTVMVALWLYLGRLPIPWPRQRVDAAEEPKGKEWKRWLFAAPLCLLVSSGGVYYAFFGCFFFIVAALAAVVRERRFGPLVAGGILVATVSVGVALNLLPFLGFQNREGGNLMVAHRIPAEAEMYGLNMSELLLPATGHRLPALRRLKDAYVNTPLMPLVNDFGSGLGIVGVIGLVFAMGALLLRAPTPNVAANDQKNTLVLTGLGALIVCGLLLGAIGGLGSLFNVYISPMIRCYDRIGIYLSFMALFGAALLLDGATRRLGRGGWMGKWGVGVLCGWVLIGGVLDETTPANVPHYKALKAEYASVCDFTAAIERTLPPGAMVLQLPFVTFPESPAVNGTGPYDHLRMYLYSHSLRWSHGTVKGRSGSDALATLCAAPIAASLERFAAMGYQGIHIDRRGYADRGQALEAQLSTLLGVQPLVSAEGRDVFFDFRPYAERVKSRYTAAQWERRREWALAPVWLRWGKNFEGRQDDGYLYWHYKTAWHGEATVVNPLKEARPVTLHFHAHVPTQITLSSPLMGETAPLDPTGVEFIRTFTAPPGETTLHFTCAAPKAVEALGLIDFNLVNEAPPNVDEPVRVTTR